MKASISPARMLSLYNLILFFLMSYLPCAFAGEKPAYTLAVPTQLSPVEMHKSWAPFVELLSKEVGVNIQLRVYGTIMQYESEIMRGIPDFAFLNPYLVVATKNTQSYMPLVRDKSALIGILVVHKDSGINSLKDLDSKEIAFPTPNAFAASLYMRALLQEKEKINFTPRYVMSHSNVYRNVILGKTTAGGGVNKSFNKEPAEVRSQLRILYTTPESAPHPLSAHRRIPKKLRLAVINAVLRLAGDSEGMKYLTAIQMPDPVQADYKKDYLILEELNLHKYFVSGGE